MSDLHWTHGGAWPLLLLLPLLAVAVAWLLRAAAGGGRRYGAPSAERPAAPLRVALLLTGAAGFLALTWLEPLLGEEVVAVERRGLDIVFCLDGSRSMLARDLEPNRLERAKRDIRAVLPQMVGGDRVGLVVFAGEAKLVVPLTHDLDSFEQLLERVDTDTVRVGGTDLAAAIHRALDLVEAGTANTTVFVLLTDGEDLGGAGRQAAAEAAAKGVVVHAVGYGSTRGSKILIDQGGQEEYLRSGKGDEVVTAMDSEGLRRLTAETGGELVRADVMPLPLVELKTKRMDPMVQRSYEAGEETHYKTRFQWVLLPAVVLLILEMLALGGRR